ncbi:barstar family protein [Fulvivirgaceae bacterium BMA12]|uniref:Barstar family protein n=1 Tax=Agaribacillus aureus TaxID=3051825 RepID=A0ABT8LE22_9BACT|nr:barstar family protein [Fulvivirgaceae bacterium BMA12]
MKAEYIIDGAKFLSKNGFYNHVEELFTFGLNWKIGRNLNAFNDILHGGFGRHDCDEKIIVKWKNLKKSRERLDEKFLEAALEVLRDNENVTFHIT